MDETEIKHILEAALLAAGRPLTLERLSEVFSVKGEGPDRATLKRVLDTLASDYQGRGIELKEVAGGYRVQVKRSMSDWLMPLWEERAPRYTRALLETLALIAYRQPITRGEIEEVRGVVVSTNIIRTLLERSWVRVVGYRDVPGKPAMFGTTREFLDYFGLKKLEDLPTLAEIKDGLPELSPQTDLIESLADEARILEIGVDDDVEAASGEPPSNHSDAESQSETASEIAVAPGTKVDTDTAADSDTDTAADSDTDTAADSEIDAEAGSEIDADNNIDTEADSERRSVIPLRAVRNRSDGAE